MATKTNATPPAGTVQQEHNGQTVEMLGGLDLRDKAELVGRPFYVVGLKQTMSERGYALMWVEGEFEDTGEKFSFNDSSSTGVADQLRNYLASVKRGDVSDEWTDCRIFLPRGLRLSMYDTKDDRGRDVKGKTFYCTTSGTRD